MSYTWDIFLAHAGADIQSAKQLYDLLESRCLVFLDSERLLLGDLWMQKLSEAQASSRVTVLLISSSTSQAWYQNAEIVAAIQRARQGEHRVVPVYLEGKALQDTPNGDLQPRNPFLTIWENKWT